MFLTKRLFPLPGRYIYFDRDPQKIQHFKGVTVYTPSMILNQSHVVMMFQSGAGVEVLENKGYMAARVYLPWTFIVRPLHSWVQVKL